MRVTKVGQDFNFLAQRTYVEMSKSFRKRYRAIIEEYNKNNKPALTPTEVLQCIKEQELNVNKASPVSAPTLPSIEEIVRISDKSIINDD